MRPFVDVVWVVGIAVASVLVLAVGAFMLGSVQGELRPAASDDEIAIYEQGLSFGRIGIALLAAGVICMLARASLRRAWGRPRVAVIVHDVVLFTMTASIFLVGAWMIGKTFFSIPTTT